MKGIIGAIRNVLSQQRSIVGLSLLSLVLCAPAAFAPLAAERGTASARSLVVVDASIRAPATFTPGGADDRVLRVDGGSDALDAIAHVVSEEGPFDSLHIVSHGQSGSMLLGGRQVDLQSLSESSLALDAIAAGLSQNAGVFLYGCSIAGTESGQTFVDAFADRLGKTVAASVDTTGGSKLGGNWDLEYASGKVIASNPFNAGLLDGYADTLSHFRGGSISWQTADLDGDGERNDIRITVKTAWRSDAINSVSSLGSTPALTITQSSESQIYVGGAGPIDADYALQTTILEARDLDPDTQYLINYSGGNRIGNLVNNANGWWDIQSTVYLKDNNLAPKIDLPIIFEVPQYQADGVTVLTDWTYDIGSTDPNADKLRYRLANLTELGGGGQTNPAGLSINPNTGLLTWSGSGTRPTGLYSGGIVAEDVDEFGNPKSKSHVDFILNLQPTAAVAFTRSSSIPETNNIRVEKGTTYAFSISGTAVETTSLGDIQGALTEPTENNFVFDPGPVGSGLDPAAYPITFEISDANDALSSSYLTLNFIVPDPNAPAIANIEGDRTVYSSLVSQPVDENLDAQLSDVDNAHFNGGRIKFNVTFTDGQYEILNIESVGDGVDEIRVDGTAIYYEGNHFATISGTLDGVGKALSIDFISEDSTIAAVQKLIRSLTYEDTFILRAVGDRSLSVFIEDPEGHTSSYDLFIDVQAHPSAPPPGGGPVEAANELIIVEGATVSISDENLNYADPDDGDTVTLTVNNVTHGQFELVSDAGNAITTFTQQQVTLGQIAFAHDGSELPPSYDVSASDGNNPATTPSAATITFTNVADQAPVISGAPVTAATENSAYTFTPAATDADIGTGSELTFAVSNLPAWTTFDTETGTLSGMPGSGDIGTHSNIVISVTDDGGLSDALPAFSITVAPDPDTDGDGVPDSVELADGTDPNDAGDYRDTDGDGVPDHVETVVDGTDPDDANDYVDSDGDGVPDYVETSVYGTDPQVADTGDTDGDGVPDYTETYVNGTDPDDAADFADTDDDGVPDYVEANVYGTDPQVADAGDTDGDGVPDYTETYVDGTDPNDKTAFVDSDGDGVPDYVEVNVYGTDPQVADAGDADGDGVPDYTETYVDATDPDDAADYLDSDGDGVPDYVEAEIDGTNAADAGDFRDSDGDGVPDYIENEKDGTDPADATDYRDSDGDGVPDYVETESDGTDPANAGDFIDTDGDGVPDYVETSVYGTNPQVADALDTDSDGVPDYTESYVDDTDPDNAADYRDTDGDGVPDYVETEADGTDPNDASDYRDTDGDGVPDYVETESDGTDPNHASDFADSDGDGVPDHVETVIDGTDPDDAADYLDSDGDGVPDYVEVKADNTDPTGANDFLDTDGDGVPDYVETEKDGTDPADAADYLDTDGDGVPDYVETQSAGTDPGDAADFTDTDGDGVPDYIETSDGTSPDDAADYRDTDGDGVPDYVETEADGTDPNDATGYRDSDGDGVPDYIETAIYGTDPQTADAGDTDGDGVPDYTETYVHGTDPDDAASYLDSDLDGVPDHVETEVDGTDPQDSNSFVDTDGDGVPDYVEVHIGNSDPADPTNYQDSDGDGVPDYVEERAGTDPGDPADAPVTFASVDATGLYTEVSLEALETLGLISAGDGANCCGHYPHSADSGAPMFEPGRNRIDWAGQGTNVLIVRPIVSLGPDTVVAEGQVASFTVWLNGPAANYPLIVPYSISGTANGQDHDLDAEGAAVFLAGETSTTVTFMVADDNTTEGNETIVVTLDDADLNIGTANVQTLTIVESNLPAQVQLSVAQAGDARMTVSQASGPVTVTAIVDDPNAGDSHTYQWSSSSSLVDTNDNAAAFTFDPQTVVEGVYEVAVSVTDDGEPAESGMASVRIRVRTSLPQLDDTDSDGDGISDAVEGYADTDQDGIPDYLDAHPARNVMQETSDAPQSYLVECDAGNACRTGMIAMAGNSGGALVSQDQAAALLQDADYENVGGLFDIDILMPVAGQHGRIVIPQRAPVPSAASFRVYIDGGWQDFVHNNGNGVYSAPGDAGMCPPPGDAAYTPGLAEGDWCVMLVVEDGGPNDVDKSSDYAASITGGVGEASEIVYKTSGGSNGGGAVHPMMLLMLAIGLFAAVRRHFVPGRMPRLPLLASILAVTVAAPGITHAQSAANGESASEAWWRSVFISANFGSAHTDVSAADLETRFADRGTSAEIAAIDRRRAGWGLSAGYRLNRLLPGLVAEVGYQDLGDVEVTFSALSTTDDIADVRPESGDGITASAAYRHALSDRFGIQMRGGLYAWEADYESYRMDSESIVDSGSASGTDLYWGLGGYWQVLERMSFDAEYQRFEFERQPAGYFRIALRWSFDH